MAALARMHDSYLLCRDPVLSLKLAAGLWGLSVLGSYLRCGAVGGQRGRGGDACGRAVNSFAAQRGMFAGRLRRYRLPRLLAHGPQQWCPPPPCSIWSLAALGFVVAFTVPALYTK